MNFGSKPLVIASFFFKAEDGRLQGIDVLLLPVFVELIIFMILSLDRRFRGNLGVRAAPYQLVYNQLMKSNAVSDLEDVT